MKTAKVRLKWELDEEGLKWLKASNMQIEREEGEIWVLSMPDEAEITEDPRGNPRYITGNYRWTHYPDAGTLQMSLLEADGFKIGDLVLHEMFNKKGWDVKTYAVRVRAIQPPKNPGWPHPWISTGPYGAPGDVHGYTTAFRHVDEETLNVL